MWFNFMLKPIYKTAPAASKKMLGLKVVKINSKIIISLHKSKSVTHSIGGKT